MTAVNYVRDRNAGNLDRIWAAGVKPSEVMISSIAAQLCILAVQLALMLTCGIFIFRLPMEGPWVILIFLCFLVGLTGMMYGLVISSFCEEESSAMQLATGSFFPALLLSGVIWPLEAIPKGISYISYALPTTWAAEAIRSVMTRGGSLPFFDVYMGFVVVGAWIAFFFALALSALKSKS